MKTKFFPAIVSAIVGIAVFLLFGVFAFAIAKLIFIYLEKDFLMSKYTILYLYAAVALIGAIVGIVTYEGKSHNKKLLKPTWTAILLDFILSAIAAFCSYIVFKDYNIVLGYKSMIVIFVMCLVLFYLFCVLIAAFMTPKKMKVNRTRNVVLAVLFNPVFVLGYLILFGMIAYNSIYVPCGVTIVGVDKNIYTANTAKIVVPGEKLVTIDGVHVSSLSDVKGYLTGLTSTKEVTVETEKNVYYLKTYDDGTRHIGLILAEKFCERKY